MRRTLTVALVVTTSLLAAQAPASAGGPRPAPAVRATYSAVGQQWQPLTGITKDGPSDATVVIDPSQARQRYSGIGFSIDETSVSNLWKLTPAQREDAIRLLVDPRTGAGLDRFRLTIGSPDLIEHLPFWSYDDLPAGVAEDWDLRYFSIQRDIDLHIVDTIKLIQKYNPKATFFASAWSAPAWMKTNNRFLGEVALKPGSTTDHYQVGKLRDECIDVFARYYAKYVEAYARHGIRVDALTLLNEPGMDVVYPAMDISVAQQQRLAVAIKRRLPQVDLYIHDFNFWDWRDPNSTETKNYYRVLDDPAARRAADAIAFHPYWGDPTVMRDAYEQTGKPVHMTETSDLDPATILSYLRLDASSYVMWAQATDQDGGTLHWTPARDNNVDWDQVAATTKWPDRLVKVDTASRTYTVRGELYAMGQFARYLDPSYTRLQSSATADGVSNVAFRDRDGHFVAVVGNARDTAARVHVTVAGESFVATVPARAYATLRWTPDLPRAHGNHAPRLAPVGDVVADQYGTTQVRLTATDRDRDRLAYYATDLPGGVSLDGTTGVVTLRPTVAGTQDLTFTVTDGVASDRVTVHVTVRPHGAPVGAVVEAEAYTAQHGWTDGGANFIENNASASGGKNVGWTAPGNWLQYRVDVAQAGTYDLELRMATGTGAVVPGAVSFRDAAGTVLATASVPDTGGWGSYGSVHVPVTLAAGDQIVTVYCETGGFNLDYFRLT
ncbi:carbohydrate-binding protein [Dactylosporangium sp. NPDC005572]|uniref:carbohydrate-binding protein n=1 Tax=Dactylosporangium sp. NPDC005572 TaxID=3156889 RepID=UPI0033B5647E